MAPNPSFSNSDNFLKVGFWLIQLKRKWQWKLHPIKCSLSRAVIMTLKLNNCKGYHTKIFVNSEVKMIWICKLWYLSLKQWNQNWFCLEIFCDMWWDIRFHAYVSYSSPLVLWWPLMHFSNFDHINEGDCLKVFIGFWGKQWVKSGSWLRWNFVGTNNNLFLQVL